MSKRKRLVAWTLSAALLLNNISITYAANGEADINNQVTAEKEISDVPVQEISGEDSENIGGDITSDNLGEPVLHAAEMQESTADEEEKLKETFSKENAETTEEGEKTEVEDGSEKKSDSANAATKETNAETEKVTDEKTASEQTDNGENKGEDIEEQEEAVQDQSRETRTETVENKQETDAVRTSGDLAEEEKAEDREISAPSDLVVSDSTYTTISLSWKEVSDADFCEIWRAEEENGEYEKIADGLTEATNYTDKTVSSGVTYYYKVRSYKMVEEEQIYSGFSGVVSGKTLSIPAPSGFEARQNGSYISLRWDYMQLRWDLLDDGAHGYEIYRSTEENGEYEYIGETSQVWGDTVEDSFYEFIDKDVELGVTYYYKVRVHNEEDGRKVYSDFTDIRSALFTLSSPNSRTTPISYNSVKVEWEKVEGAEHYQVYRSTEREEGYVLLGTYDSNTTFMISQELGAGITYYYKVRACGTVNGEQIYGMFAGPLSATPSLSAPEQVEAKASSYNTVDVRWSKVDGAEYYQVYRGTSKNGEYSLLGTYNSDTTLKVSKQLKCGTKYYYKVRAYRWVNGERAFSAFSDIKDATPEMSPVQSVQAKASSYNTIDVSWSKVDGAEGYQVYRGDNYGDFSSHRLLGNYDSNTTSMVSRQLACGEYYSYWVRAYRWAGGEKVFSPLSKAVGARVTLSPPQNVKASRGSYNTVNLSWSKVDGANYYQVYRATSKNGKYTFLGSYESDTTSSVSRQLGCGTKYYYKVRAYRWVNGERVYSSFSTIVNATPTLSAPQNIKATPQTTSTVKISWDKVAGANYYQVYRATSINGKYSLLGVYDSSTTSSISKQLKSGTTYYYKVRAYRWVGGKRVYSSFSTKESAKTY